jgi:hypothetical protein
LEEVLFNRKCGVAHVCGGLLRIAKAYRRV